MATDFESLQRKQEKFVSERDWEDYHTPKNLAMALSVECGELAEIYQWRENESKEAVKSNSELLSHTEEELADILIYAMSMASQLNIDLLGAVDVKLDKNREKYPESQAGSEFP